MIRWLSEHFDLITGIYIGLMVCGCAALIILRFQMGRENY